jgi:hypothetical protein
MTEHFHIAELPERSILYVSVKVGPEHPLRQAVVTYMDPLPDLDLNRITAALGPGSRRYFTDKVLDATGCKPMFGMTAIHSDNMAEIPSEGFQVLAHSEESPNQVVAYGERVRLLGLHPEVSAEFLARTIQPIIDAGAFSSVPREELRAAFASICPSPESNRLILRNFLTHFCTRQWGA